MGACTPTPRRSQVLYRCRKEGTWDADAALVPRLTEALHCGAHVCLIVSPRHGKTPARAFHGWGMVLSAPSSGSTRIKVAWNPASIAHFRDLPPFEALRVFWGFCKSEHTSLTLSFRRARLYDDQDFVLGEEGMELPTKLGEVAVEFLAYVVHENERKDACVREAFWGRFFPLQVFPSPVTTANSIK